MILKTLAQAARGAAGSRIGKRLKARARAATAASAPETRPETSPETARDGTVDRADIARFESMADRWWDVDGPHAPLHRFVPVRMALIRDALAPLATEPTLRKPLKGVRVLDVGCGGGLLCEPMTRLGADVVGIDADGAGIDAARVHAAAVGLAIDYRVAPAESLAKAGERFDAIVASEVIEHVADRAAFLDALIAMLRPGGTLVLTTINRTQRSYAVAIVGAEYILRMVPRRTHDWNQFPTPQELETLLEERGMAVEPAVGFHYDPLSQRFEETADTRVNYGLIAHKAD